MDHPANPADAMRQLTRFAKQLREYVKETADEITPYIDHRLAEYVAGSIEKLEREQITLDKAFGIAQSKKGAPAKKNRASDPEGFKQEQLLIFNALQLREERPPVQWKAIPHRIGYRGSWKQLQKLCLEKADKSVQTALELGRMPVVSTGPRARKRVSP
jgi:hypothetical protein